MMTPQQKAAIKVAAIDWINKKAAYDAAISQVSTLGDAERAARDAVITLMASNAVSRVWSANLLLELQNGVLDLQPAEDIT